MAKRVTYIGAHTVTGSSVGFAGFGVKRNRKYPIVGLVETSPLIDEKNRYQLIKSVKLENNSKNPSNKK
jgi:hypothetical protein